MFLRLLTIAALLLLTVTPSLADRHAIVIGVNAVPQFKVHGVYAVRPLRGAEYDARRFAEALQASSADSETHLELLLGADANHEAVLEAMGRVAELATSDDTVVFYFAGHGTQAPDRAPFDEPDEERLDEALCLSDANSRGENLLIDDELAKWQRGLSARSVTFVLDCCHSGTGIKSADDEPRARGLTLPSVRGAAPTEDASGAWRELSLLRKASGGRVLALYACQAEQSAYERRFMTPDGPQPMGQFTRFLLRAMAQPQLADRDNDGLLSIGEAAAYVAEQIESEFNTDRPAKKRQTPHFEAERADWELTPAG